MRASANLLLWRLWDMTLILIGAVLSVIILVVLKVVAPLIAVSLFAFVTIRFDDLCIADYVIYAFKFCVSKQQLFLWRMGE
jgi:hypothetical protein